MISVKNGDTVTTKKAHPCGCNTFEVIRTGADYKLRCTKCNRIIMLDSEKLHKVVKNVIGQTEN